MDRIELAVALAVLETYGPARNREVDKEERSVHISDDGAVAILEYIKELENGNTK